MVPFAITLAQLLCLRVKFRTKGLISLSDAASVCVFCNSMHVLFLCVIAFVLAPCLDFCISPSHSCQTGARMHMAESKAKVGGLHKVTLVGNLELQ